MQKLIEFNEKSFNNVDVSSDATSKMYDIRSAIGYSIHTYWENITGTVSIITEASNDTDTFALTTSNWAPIQTFNLVPSNGNRILNVEVAHYCFIRFRIVQINGTGNFTLIATAKK